MSQDAIIYTITDEAPFCATSALLPIIRAFAAAADVPVETMDISLAGRLISQFPECLTEAQQQPDDLARLGKIVLQPTANIIISTMMEMAMAPRSISVCALRNRNTAPCKAVTAMIWMVTSTLAQLSYAMMMI